jgi:hypothetical protein
MRRGYSLAQGRRAWYETFFVLGMVIANRTGVLLTSVTAPVLQLVWILLLLENSLDLFPVLATSSEDPEDQEGDGSNRGDTTDYNPGNWTSA